MKYILVMVVWSMAQGGAPMSAEFDDAKACLFAADDLKEKLNRRHPTTWMVTCYPKSSNSQETK